MRRPKYISPSAFDLWLKNKEKYFCKYLADIKPPGFPQTRAMSVGSAFDAYVKNYLIQILFGKVPPEFELKTLLKSQVEEHNLEWATEHGKIVFNAYQESGALADLLLDLRKSAIDPGFEFATEGIVQGVPIKGYPDCFYLPEMMKVIVDWKVNGYCSKTGGKPKPYYIRNTKDRQPHKKASIITDHGIVIGLNGLEEVDKQWARQQCMYAWLLSADVGESFVCTIEQLCCRPTGITTYVYRAGIGKFFQQELINGLKEAWEIINSDWIFRDLSEEESKEKQDRLNSICNLQASNDPFMTEMR